jgi:hypothetical protein
VSGPELPRMPQTFPPSRSRCRRVFVHQGPAAGAPSAPGTSVVARATDLETLAIEFDTHRAELGANLILNAEELSRAAKISREIIDSLIDRSNAERAPAEFRHAAARPAPA